MGNMSELEKGFIAIELVQLAAFYDYNGFTEKDASGTKTENAKMKLKTYVEELSGLKPEQIRTAFKRIRQGWKPSNPNPFPAIPDILSAVGEAPDDGAHTAIATVKGAGGHVTHWDSVCFCDPALHWVISNFAEGWQSLCAWTWDDWNINMGKLIEAYREAKKKGLDSGNHLSGYAECRDGGGYVHWIDVHDKSNTGEIRFMREIPAEGIAKLNELCYGKRETAALSDGNAAALIGSMA